MLMGTNNSGIDEQLFHVGIATQFIGHALPDAAVTPTGKANVGAVPVAELTRQIPPGAAGTQHPKNRFDEEAVIFGSAARITGLAWQEVFNTRPLVISQALRH